MAALVNRRRCYTGNSGGIDYSKMYFTIESLEDGNTISIENVNYGSTTLTFYYSTDDGENWNSVIVAIDTTENIATLDIGEKVIIKQDNSNRLSRDTNVYHKFTSNKNFKVYGNIMSLLRGDNFVSNPELPGTTWHFHKLFQDVTTLIDAENLILPSTIMRASSYRNMFNGCTNLVSAPTIFASTVASDCCYAMFQNCTSLINTPQLLATTMQVNCYYDMFKGCTSLVTPPNLPATTLADNCYRNMFEGCTSLVNTPLLLATTLAEYCYHEMFKNCTSLTVAPQLPAITLAYCCYTGMFEGCINLLEAPELPAVTLAPGCYQNMFRMSKTEKLMTPSMTKSPILPAISVTAQNCYKEMFKGNGNLNEVICLAEDVNSSYCASNWLTNASSTGTFIKSASATGWSRDTSGIPSGWTVYSDGLLGISISGSGVIDVRDVTYSIAYNPSDTLDKYKGVTWSVVSGNATITQDGVLTPTAVGNVVIQAVSTYDSSIVATKTVTVIDASYTFGNAIQWNDIPGGVYTDTHLMIRERLEFDYMVLSRRANEDDYVFRIGGQNASKTDGITFYCDIIDNRIKVQSRYMNTSSGDYRDYVYLRYNVKISSDNTIINDTTLSYSSTPVSVEPSHTAYIGSLYNEPNPPAGTGLPGGRLYSLKIDNNVFLPVKRLNDNKVGLYCESLNNFIDFSVFNAELYVNQFENEYFTIESLADSNAITIQNVNCDVKPTFYYSLDDGDTWSSVTMTKSSTQNIATINTGDKILFKSTNNNLGTDWGKYNRFNSSKNFKVYGNAMSLLYGDNFAVNSNLYSSAAHFAGLFRSTTTLVDASNLVLPSYMVFSNSYNGMFRDCTNLVYAPKLPALYLISGGCYSSMFEGCVGLIEAPELPATTLIDECYARMFCMSRTTKLTTPAMTKSPLLPATTVGTNSYKEMFKGNGNLVEITCLATNVASNAPDWVLNVSSTGTFKKNANMSSWTTGTSGIPSGWTVVDYVEE